MTKISDCDYCHGVGACPSCWGRAQIEALRHERDEARALAEKYLGERVSSGEMTKKDIVEETGNPPEVVADCTSAMSGTLGIRASRRRRRFLRRRAASLWHRMFKLEFVVGRTELRSLYRRYARVLWRLNEVPDPFESLFFPATKLRRKGWRP